MNESEKIALNVITVVSALMTCVGFLGLLLTDNPVAIFMRHIHMWIACALVAFLAILVIKIYAGVRIVDWLEARNGRQEPQLRFREEGHSDNFDILIISHDEIPDDECAICLEPLSPETRRMANCGHLFHLNCQRNWRQQQRHDGWEPTCAVCRQ